MNWLVELIEMGALYQFYHEHDFTGESIVKFGRSLGFAMIMIGVKELGGDLDDGIK